VYLCFVIGSVSDFRRQSLENFEDAKGVIRNRKSKKNRQQIVNEKRENGQIMIYKTLLRLISTNTIKAGGELM
jgi:hypothetical protein